MIESKRPVIVCLLILLAADLAAPLVSAYHEHGHPETSGGEAPTLPVATPSTVEQVRRDALDALADASREIGQLAGEAGLELTLPPPLPSPIFVDGIDEGTRVGGFGDYAEVGRLAWGVTEGAGWNGSAARSVGGPNAASYGGGERLLVSPAIDLSAYPIQVCGTPYLCSDPSELATDAPCAAYSLVWSYAVYSSSRPSAGDPSGGIPERVCLTTANLRDEEAIRSGVRDQINLILKHTFNLARDLDGAQVWGFPFDPVDKFNAGTSLTSIYRAGRLLTPENSSSYSPNVASLGNAPGFTGARDWETLVFDLTPFAGQKLHLGFRFVASPRADSEGPAYFRTPNFDRPTGFGWTIDDLEVIGPALQNDVKVGAIDAPSMRKGQDDPTEYVARRATFNVTASILNAASIENRIRATFTAAGAAEGTVTETQETTLPPGAVWTPVFSLSTPDVEGRKVNVVVKAETLAKGGGVMADPTPSNDALSQDYSVSTIRSVVVDVNIPPATAMVDDDEPLEATGTLFNGGNGVEALAWRLTDAWKSKTLEIATGTVVLAPGETARFRWTVHSPDRGEHLVNFTASGQGLVAKDVARYFVHASPPPLFADLDTTPDNGWYPVDSSVPEVIDGGYWMSTAVDVTKTSLNVLPQPVTQPRFQDLKLQLRYMVEGGAVVVDFAPRGLVSVGPRETLYGDPAREPGVVWSSGAISPRGHQDWRAILYQDTPEASARRQIEEDRSWHYYTVDVLPEAGRGYFNLWNPSLYEVRLKTTLNSGTVFIDDLRLTGVPEGAAEKDRVDLFRLVGDETDLVFPPRPIPVNTGTSEVRQLGYDDGWKIINATTATRASLQGFNLIQWTNLTPLGQPHRFTGVDPAPVLWQSFIWDNLRHPLDVDNTNINDNATRLITPTITLNGSVDPVFRFDHEYGFPGRLDDIAAAPQYYNQRAAMVDIAYKRPDGDWSSWIRLEPVGNYPHYFEYTDNGLRRESAVGPRPSDKHYRGGEGYFWPGPCTSPQFWCAGTVTHTMMGADGNVYLAHLPTSQREPATFRLRDQAKLSHLDLEGLEVRFAFHLGVMSYYPLERSDTTLWRIGSVQLDPVSVFATDAAITKVDIPVAYDWRTLGLGPGSVVPINLTLANVGLYKEDFSARVEVRKLGGETVASFVTRAGEMRSGETRDIVVRALIPPDEDVLYEIVATAFPTNAELDRDENTWNDVQSIGRDGTLFAKTRIDLSAWNGVFPVDGRTTLPRVLSTGIRNLGNVAVPDVEILQRIERLTENGAILVADQQWKLENAVVADPTSVSLARLLGTPLAEDTMFFTPGEPGNYVVTFALKLPPEFADDSPLDNLHREYLTATQAVIADDFESGIGLWTPSDGRLWSNGEGFRGGRALVGGNASGGLVDADAHGWIESPTIPLGNLREAKVNFLARYDLEEGYDGLVAEYLGVDGWAPITPAGPDGRPGTYPSQVLGSNPLTRTTTPEAWTPAFSGNSRTSGTNLDGWTPVSFDFSHLPEVTESVTLVPLEIPSLTGEALVSASDAVYVPESLAATPSEQRWEIHNQTETMRRPVNDAFWWTGRHATPPTGVAATTETLSRTANIAAILPEENLTLTWSDWRAGRTGAWWTGVGMDVDVTAQQVVNNVVTTLTSTSIRLLNVSADGEWHNLTRTFYGYNPNLPLTINFVATRHRTAINDLGWAVENVRLEAVVNRDGRFVATKQFLGHDESPAEISAWTPSGGWRRAAGISPREATWSSTVRTGPDGAPRAAWTFSLDPTKRFNVDARLVSPVLDLSSIQGTRASLDIEHRHQLLFLDGAAVPLTDNFGNPAPNWTTNRAYQAGTVEISMFNRSTQSWDPWRQLFTDARGPETTLNPPPFRVAGSEPLAAPYPVTIPDAGDTFERYTRNVTQRYGTDSQIAFDAFEVPTAFAFSGTSDDNGQTWVPARFDLTPYIGEEVRIAFHGWSGAQWGGTEPGASNRFWEIGDIRVVGEALSSYDTKLRFRLGTDYTGREGSFEIDQFEILGEPYHRSVALTVDAPTALGSKDPALVRVTLRNHGADERRFTALGIKELRSEPPAEITILDAPVARADGYRAAAGPFRLAPAGEEGSNVSLELLIYPRSNQDVHRLVFEVLDGYLTPTGLAYAPARDDVPHRASRVIEFVTEDTTTLTITGLATSRPYLEEPGNFSVSGVLENLGTTTVAAAIQVRIEKAGTTPPKEVARITLPIATTNPGFTRPFETPVFNVTEKGDYLVKVSALRITPTATTTLFAAPDHVLRVGTNELRFTSFFEKDLDGWVVTSAVRRDDGDAASGRWSLLYGATDQQYAAGARLATAQFPQSVTVVSPPIDLRGLGTQPMLAFKHKPMLGGIGVVIVQATLQGCGSWATLTPLAPGMTTRGRLTDWEVVFMDLSTVTVFCGGTTPLTERVIIVRFLVGGNDQGWRLDDLAVLASIPEATPPTWVAHITDEAHKVYAYRVRNPGASNLTVAFALDRERSAVLAEQMEWFTFVPPSLDLGPRSDGVVELHVRTPASRDNVLGRLAPIVRYFNPDLPEVFRTFRADLTFDPRPRADLAVNALIDGRVAPSRIKIEEAIPHELTAIVRNRGDAATPALPIQFRVTSDDTGDVVWELRTAVDGLPPIAVSEESTVTSVSWKPTFGDRGNRTLTIVVDPEHASPDTDRSNNRVVIPLEVVPVVRPDLSISPQDVSFTTLAGDPLFEATPGELIRVTATARNLGLAPARTVTLSVISGSTVLGQETWAVVEPSQAATLALTQFAPTEPTTYRFLVSTQDLEGRSENNQLDVEVPIYPPELVVPRLAKPIEMKPGEGTAIQTELSNEGPYPLLLNLTGSLGGGSVAIEPDRLALAPGEKREIVLRVVTRGDLEPGLHLVRLLATGPGFRAVRSIPIEVERHPALALTVHPAIGTTAAKIQFDAANVGNLAVQPTLVLRDRNGVELARTEASRLDPGSARLGSLTWRIPPSTPPGPMEGELLVLDGHVERARSPVTIQVAPWGRVRGTVVEETRGDGGARRYALDLAYEGNAPSTRSLALYGLEAGNARFNRSIVDLVPGESTRVALTVATPSGLASGLRALQVALIDPMAVTPTLEASDLVEVLVDLRNPRVQLKSAERGVAEVKSNDVVTYHAAVRNTGDAMARNVSVRLFVDGLLVDHAVVAELGPGSEERVTVDWRAKTGEHAVAILVSGPVSETPPAFAESLSVSASLVEIPKSVPGAELVLALAVLAILGVVRRRPRR